jgi:hypothetical protein
MKLLSLHLHRLRNLPKIPGLNNLMQITKILIPMKNPIAALDHECVYLLLSSVEAMITPILGQAEDLTHI